MKDVVWETPTSDNDMQVDLLVAGGRVRMRLALCQMWALSSNSALAEQGKLPW